MSPTKENSVKSSVKRVFSLILSRTYGMSDVTSYSRALHSYEPHPVHKDRQELLYQVIQQEAARIFGKGTAIKHEAVHSIVDHHDILNHPSFVSSNVVANLFKILKGDHASENIVVLTDSGVPAGHFANKNGLKFGKKFIKIFSRKYNHSTICSLPPIDLSSLLDDSNVLHDIFNGTTDPNQDDGAQSTYADQVSHINKKLWKNIFAAPLRDRVPNLLYIPCQDVASAMLQTYLADENHPVSKILLDPVTRGKTLDCFEGVSCCWQGAERGTHFFWSVGNTGAAERLWVRGNALRDETGTRIIELTPESILSALRSRSIYPNLFLAYGILVFHCGIKPLTGGRSTQYMSEMKKKWIEFYGSNTDALTDGKNSESTKEKDLVSGIPVRNPIQGDYVDSHALDLAHAGGMNRSQVKAIEVRRFVSSTLAKISHIIRHAFLNQKDYLK